MSAFAQKDTVFIYGPPSSGKTYLMQALLGEYRKPVICVDPGFGEWHEPAHKSFLDAEGLAEYLVDCADEGKYPEPVLSVAAEAAEGTFRFVWKAEVGCTLIVDEIDEHAPNSGKTNEDLHRILKRGRKIQGKDSPASISVIGACHAAQEVDRAVARFGAHICFEQSEPRAVERASEYLHHKVDPGKLGKYEFAVSKKVERLSFYCGEWGPGVWRYEDDRHCIEQVDTFPR